VNAGFPLRALDKPLGPVERRTLRSTLAALLHFQRRLGAWPRFRAAADATPIVSLYARGRLLGCSACGEGRPGERLARAFLSALGDPRGMGVDSTLRREVVVQVAYPVRARRVSLDAASRLTAAGAHGVALSDGATLLGLLVPEVARELGVGTSGLLEALERKAECARASWPLSGFFVFETERVVVRSRVPRVKAAPRSAIEAAVRWLVARVGPDGAVSFVLDPRAPADEPVGPMLHARAAVVIRALAAHPAGARARKRAMAWLGREIASARAGRSLAACPDEAPLVAGTLALAKLAGLEVDAQLIELAKSPAVRAHAWHAWQVALALGRSTPPTLWRACVRSLEREPRAPWIALAAAEREDWSTYERAATALAAHVIEHGPHQGGVPSSADLPELALTAIVVEALAHAKTQPLQRALRLAHTFLERQQLLDDPLPEAIAPERVHGAFPLTPVHSFLRSDVTAHAVLAFAGAPADYDDIGKEPQ